MITLEEINSKVDLYCEAGIHVANLKNVLDSHENDPEWFPYIAKYESYAGHFHKALEYYQKSEDLPKNRIAILFEKTYLARFEEVLAACEGVSGDKYDLWVPVIIGYVNLLKQHIEPNGQDGHALGKNLMKAADRFTHCGIKDHVLLYVALAYRKCDKDKKRAKALFSQLLTSESRNPHFFAPFGLKLTDPEYSLPESAIIELQLALEKERFIPYRYPELLFLAAEAITDLPYCCLHHILEENIYNTYSNLLLEMRKSETPREYQNAMVVTLAQARLMVLLKLPRESTNYFRNVLSTIDKCSFPAVRHRGGANTFGAGHLLKQLAAQSQFDLVAMADHHDGITVFTYRSSIQEISCFKDDRQTALSLRYERATIILSSPEIQKAIGAIQHSVLPYFSDNIERLSAHFSSMVKSRSVVKSVTLVCDSHVYGEGSTYRPLDFSSVESLCQSYGFGVETVTKSPHEIDPQSELRGDAIILLYHGAKDGGIYFNGEKIDLETIWTSRQESGFIHAEKDRNVLCLVCSAGGQKNHLLGSATNFHLPIILLDSGWGTKAVASSETVAVKDFEEVLERFFVLCRSGEPKFPAKWSIFV